MLNRTPSTASQTSSGVRPPRTTEAGIRRGGVPCWRARKSTRKSRVPLPAVQPPQLAYAQIGVACDFPFVGTGDLDLDHEIRRGAFQEGVGRQLAIDDSRLIAPGARPDVERTVGLHPRARRFAPPAKTGRAKPLGGAGHDGAGGVHDVREDLGQVVVQARGGHQRDEAPHRIETDPRKRPIPVDRRERRHRRRIGAQNVDGGAERPGERCRGAVHATDRARRS